MFTRLFFRFDINGLENFPKHGPYIIAGNHVGSIEALLMVCFAPEVIEIIGAGDIPLEPKLAGFADLYGYIPINRGEIDQTGLKMALQVLKNRGVLGIFPEGGIWEPNIKSPKIGVSWLSSRSQAPVVPVGFIGVKNALIRAFRLEFPRISMRVGCPLYPEDFIESGLPQKESLSKAAAFIMSKIVELVPESEAQPADSDFQRQKPLHIEIMDNISKFSAEIEIREIGPLSQLLQHPVIMGVFLRNLQLPVKSLMTRNHWLPLEQAWLGGESIFTYITEKPGFLIYRFGIDQGLKMKEGLADLLAQTGQKQPPGAYSIRFIEEQ
jgi:1-acyl-sn-glycerol-3-phosphate acyltransferase